MKVIVEKHDPYWKLIFQKEEQRILAALKIANISTKIAHIGSTSVPNLAARPVIDIMLGLPVDCLLDACVPVFNSLGYIYVSKYKNMMPSRCFFIKIKSTSPLQKWKKNEITYKDSMPNNNVFKRIFHLHVVHEDTLFYKRHIAFRNHLRKNVVDRQAYETLKLHLAELDWETENNYAQAKSRFIEGIMDQLGF